MSLNSTSERRYSLEQVRAFGLLEEEYGDIVEQLGREPNLVELGILGAMWSEHCGYKHSRRLLKLLPTTGPRVLQGPGENAGAVSIGAGLAVTLKMESHNHPSAVEPVQGAATGVGGILRDIFTMGARPVAILDSLRFGDPKDARTPFLVNGVIGGIGFYGNCIGVPTVGGEISFDASYTGNPLVNAMAVGIVAVDKITLAGATGPGNPLIMVGADTGRDGIQGAAFASNDDPEASHRGVIQVGNPFLEKLLLEACLTLIDTGRVLAMQDLGAAGLTSSAVEMASRGGLGVEIDVALVPRRETGMTPFEVMLSESQERMLVVVEKGDEQFIRDHFGRWGLHAEVIGSVTDDGMLRVRDGEEIAGELPIPLLTDDVPAYELKPGPPRADTAVSQPKPAPASVTEGLKLLLASPNVCSRFPAFSTYDSTVQANTVLGPGGGAALVRVDGTTKGIAITTDCNPRYTRLDPRRGAAQAIAEAARNIACVGAEPIAATDCLNFGNPEKPDVAWQLTEAIHGLAEACLALDVPIVSGNVSLYNESAGKAIAPTPAVGMVGLIEDVSKAVGVGFREGEMVIHLGKTAKQLSASEYRGAVLGDEGGPFPYLDLAEEKKLGQLLRDLVDRGLIRSAQDCSEGGLAVALAESCFAHGVGFQGKAYGYRTLVEQAGGEIEAALFSEDQGRAIISCVDDSAHDVLRLAKEQGVDALVLGSAKGSDVRFGPIETTVDELRQPWATAFQAILGGQHA